ncbi:lytic transglycosylase domain-containing protein [Oligoflexus tunisiensis]|uniref:lytic transglycosylase domain-containing protein n=1 Tax=Oligoflexus tunisiensis TaxID=708132 RepID=UPI00114CFEC2|nr:lytic transglycosylase domain-containing protein [Oligoflexus tunisiensis]
MRRYLTHILLLAATLATPGNSSTVYADSDFNQNLKQALNTLKQQQDEKSRNALNALAEQVQGDMEPAKRLQAAIMLAAFYWDSNYRLSRTYLGIAESLRNPTVPELSRFDAEIDHMKVRFRHAALLDPETKRELENQLRADPPEPLRLSLVEMLLDTNDALKLNADFIAIYKRYYTRYPRTVRRDRFLRKAADIYYAQGDTRAYFQQLEGLLDQYPVSEEAKASLDRLIEHAHGKKQPAYSFTYSLLKKVYRNSSHDPEQQKRILSLVSTPMRRTSKVPAKKLDLIDQIRLYTYLQLYDEALGLTQTGLAQANVPQKLRDELTQWNAYILSEKGDHQTALTRYPSTRSMDLFFQESQAKSLMSSQQFPQAAQLYGQLMKRRDHPRYRWYYFWNSLAAGNLDVARRFVSTKGEQIFNEAGFRRDASLYWRGRAAISSGQLEEAQQLFKPFMDRPQPGYYGMLAKSALAQGRKLAEKSKSAMAESEDGTESSASDDSVSPKALLAAYKPMDRQETEELKSAVTVPASGARNESIPFANYVYEIAKVAEMDPYLILSIIKSESAFNSRALSTAGAQGLMQLMPYTAVRLARLLDDEDFRLDQLQAADTNLLYGSLYLALLLNYYNGHEVPAVAAYNAGPHVVNKWLSECQNCPVDAFVEFIPYAETRNYVKKVLNTYSGYYQAEPQREPDYLFKALPTEFPDTQIF